MWKKNVFEKFIISVSESPIEEVAALIEEEIEVLGSVIKTGDAVARSVWGNKFISSLPKFIHSKYICNRWSSC